MLLPSVVIVGYYFERRRALATGIVCCGSGVGTCIFPPVCYFLLMEYGWRGTMWIISGLVLHGAAFGILYIPINEKREPINNFRRTVTGPEQEQVAPIRTRGSHGASEIKIVCTDASIVCKLPDITTGSVYNEADGPVKSEISKLPLNGSNEPLQTASNGTVQKSKRNLPKDYRSMSDQSVRSAFRPCTKERLLSMSENVVHIQNTIKYHGLYQRAFFNPKVPKPYYLFLRKDSFYVGNLYNIPEFRTSDSILAYRKDVMIYDYRDDVIKTKNDFRTTKCHKKPALQKQSGNYRCFILRHLKRLFDFSLLKDPRFLLFALANFLTMAGKSCFFWTFDDLLMSILSL